MLKEIFHIIPPHFLAVLAAMALGYATRRFGLLPASSARSMMVWVQRNVTPWVLVISFWGLKLSSLTVMALPLIGLAVIALQMLLALGAARILRLEGARRGVFMISAALSNIGYLGWTINLSLFGKQGFDYSFMYGFYFTFAVYLISYPIAAHYSPDRELKERPFFRRLTVEGILVIAVIAVFAGVALNLTGVPRPAFMTNFNAGLVVAATAAMMFAAGLTISVRSFKEHAASSVAMSVIKLAASPLIVAAALAACAGPLGLDPLMSKVVVVESMMPMAISCLTVCSIFHLDRDMANSMWLASTLLFFAIFQTALIILHIT